MKKINESLDYMDMEGQLSDTITVDEYSAKMGKDKDIVTITFTVYSELAANDLVSWFERGYDFVLDASVSDGELEPGKFLVFVEMRRRAKVPQRICKLLSDLTTLTGYKITDWTIDLEGDEIDADEKILSQKMILNPNLYKMEKEKDEKINEYKELAGIPISSNYKNDEYIKHLKSLAGM